MNIVSAGKGSCTRNIKLNSDGSVKFSAKPKNGCTVENLKVVINQRTISIESTERTTESRNLRIMNDFSVELRSTLGLEDLAIIIENGSVIVTNL